METNTKTKVYGDVQDCIHFDVRYTNTKRDGAMLTEEKVRRNVSFISAFYGNGGFSFRELQSFRKAANELLQLVKSLLANGTYVEVDLSVSAYEQVPAQADEPMSTTLQQLKFDCWKFAGSALEGDPDNEESGLYLQPDTRYTPAHRDIFIPWQTDILDALSEAGL